MRPTIALPFLLVMSTAMAQEPAPPPMPPEPLPPLPTEPKRLLALDLITCYYTLEGKEYPWLNSYWVQGYAYSGNKLDDVVLTHASQRAYESRRNQRLQGIAEPEGARARCKTILASAGPLPPQEPAPTDPVDAKALDLLACHARFEGWNGKFDDARYLQQAIALTSLDFLRRYSRTADTRSKKKAMQDEVATRKRCDGLMEKTTAAASRER